MRKCVLLLAASGFCMTSGFCMAAESAKTLTGVISDDMCGADHKAMGGTDAAKCTAQCVPGMGAKYALVVGKDVYTLSDQVTPVKLAGQKVTVKGTLNGKELKVDSIVPAK